MDEILFSSLTTMLAGVAAVYVSAGILARVMAPDTRRMSPSFFHLFCTLPWGVLTGIFIADLMVITPSADGPWKEVLTIAALAIMVSLPAVLEFGRRCVEKDQPSISAGDGAYQPLLDRVRRMRAGQLAMRR